MTKTIAQVALISALRNRQIFNAQILDAEDYGDNLQIWFYDKSRTTLVLTEPISCGEAQEIMSNLPKARRRQIVRAYSL